MYDNPPYYISAYSLAVKAGFKGTLREWLASLQGEKGDKVELRYLDDKIQWRWIPDEGTAEESQWQDLLNMAEIRGEVVEETLDEVRQAAATVDALLQPQSIGWELGALDEQTGEKVDNSCRIRAANTVISCGKAVYVAFPQGVKVRQAKYDDVLKFEELSDWLTEPFQDDSGSSFKLIVSYADDRAVENVDALGALVTVFYPADFFASYQGDTWQRGWMSFELCTQEGHYSFPAEAVQYILDAPPISVGGILDVRRFDPDGTLAQTIWTEDGAVWFRLGDAAFAKLLPPEGAFCVSVTQPGTASPVADKTFAEIMAAYEAGQAVYCLLGYEYVLPLSMVTGDGLSVLFQGANQRYYQRVVIESDDTLTYTSGNYALRDDLPTALPNPNKLILTGAVAAEYDGSGEVAVEIPEVAGADGATYTPSVSADGVLSWTNDKGLDNPAPVSVVGPQGPAGADGGQGAAGADGKSAYEYAKDGGYTGTEAEFAAKLAQEAPKAFYVTVTYTDEETQTADKTFSETKAAIDAGSPVALVLHRTEEASHEILGSSMVAVVDDLTLLASIVDPYGTLWMVVLTDEETFVQAIPVVPDTLPNPNALTINGQTYDGSAAVNITISAKPLAGKKVVCFGDSLFGMYHDSTGAPAIVGDETGATVYNVGFGGCRMAVHPTTGYAEFCMWALATAIASGDWSAQDAAASSGSSYFPDQLAILKGIDFSTVDIAVIHYGTNDFYNWGNALDNADDPDDYNTVCGALRYSLDKLLTAYPNLRIYVSLPVFRYWTADDGTVTYSDDYTNKVGYTFVEGCAAIASVAREYKLPVIDGYYGLGINAANAATFLQDGTHHNAAGRKRFGSFIGACLTSQQSSALTLAEVKALCGSSGSSGGSGSGYTNQLPLATDTDGSVYNGVGYAEGYRLDSAGTAGEQNGSYLSGFIPCAVADVVRLSGVTWTTDSTNFVQRLAFYDSSHALLDTVIAANAITGMATGEFDEDGNVCKFTVPLGVSGVAYFRFNCLYIGSESIVTVNEVIE